MPDTSVTFQNHHGDTLAATLSLPQGPVLSTALIAHCFTCSKDLRALRRISARLSAMGFAVLRFDFTGLGQSGGAFGEAGLGRDVKDIEAAAAYLATQDLPPALLIGHSLGGAAALRAAGQIDGLRAVATIGAPFDPAHVLGHITGADEIDGQDDNSPRAPSDGAEVDIGGRPFHIRRSFIDEMRQGDDPAAPIADLHRALLVLHAPRDATVGIDNAAQIFMAAKHPKSFVTLDGADHLLTRPEDAEYAAEVIATWAGKYIDLAPPAPPRGAPEGIVRVSEADPDGFLQDVQNGPHHHFLADEPVAYGGTNRGPSPYGLLGAGLGACTSMTIRMYARRKGWPLTHVSVDVSHDKVHGQDSALGQTGKIDSFRRLIRLEGDLTASQRAKLLEIADKCPVHRTLERASQVETELA
ncbi:osmotically inducible protein C [Litorivita pollutaquae]|uniref:Osmotically inducible protein C n=1 Tax=Litorivita pollutaquae TaxID=2200892 RepID=A0A2V4MTA1_9RHOB|nr:alpha/beta fold hydrolase [Litorivita pollutaquae]PYC48739.1 osmotically inducible protein C [Litorivita pollutaquae]